MTHLGHSPPSIDAPCAERSRAAASPSPLLAPVMTTTLPSMLLTFSFPYLDQSVRRDAGGRAAIDRKHHTGDETGVVGEEEGDRCRDLFGLALTANRMSRADSLHIFRVLEHDLRQRRADHPRRHGIDADAKPILSAVVNRGKCNLG
jgi:hypothetical protein